MFRAAIGLPRLVIRVVAPALVRKTNHRNRGVIMTTIYHSLAGGSLTQNWSGNQITTNDDWSQVPSITGYLGDIDAGSPTGVNPTTLTGAALGAVDVIADQAAPNTNISGGVAEFDGIANPTVALQGSGTADAPALVIYL